MAHDLEKKFRTKDVLLLENVDFSSMLLCDRVLAGLANAGFKKPSPIQLEAIPTGRFGKDLLVQAKSGTGKTLVFVIVALEMLHRKLFRPQVLILTPTREIATQICSVIKSIGSYFPKLTCESFIGGLPVTDDLKKVHNCQIVTGTPGRIKQLIEIKALSTSSIRLVVFDEADEMFEFSRLDEIDFIFNCLPEDKQVIAASATYPPKLKKTLFRYLRDPFVAQLDTTKLALLGIVHYVKIVESSAMPLKLYRLKIAALEEILKSLYFTQCLVYCNGINRVESIYRDIKRWGFSTTYISSNRDQAARLKAIDCLKRFKCKVLVSSDVTARGIDAENVDLVINFDVSNYTEKYLHRSGRAGRYGTVGATVSIVDFYELQRIKNIEKGGSFKTYLLPDPVPVDLIKNPCLDTYAIEPSEEIEKCDESTEKKLNEISKDENGDAEKSIVVQNGTASECTPISATNDNENISEKQNGVSKITCEGSSPVTEESGKNDHFNGELNSQVENGSTPMCKKDTSSCEEAIDSIKPSESIAKNTFNSDKLDSNFSVQSSEISNVISGDNGVDFAVQDEGKNSDILSTSECKMESSTVLNSCKNSDNSIAVASENDCIASLGKNCSDINVQDSPILSVKDQNVKSILQDDDLNKQLINEVQSGNSLNKNEIDHAIENFVQKYEKRELTASGNGNNFSDLENSVTGNSDRKNISLDHRSVSNSRCDYYSKVFKLFQEDKSCDRNESVMKEDSEGAEKSVEHNVSVKEIMSCIKESCEENYSKTQEISNESSSVTDPQIVDNLKIQILPKFSCNSIPENASTLDDDTISNFSVSPCHESTPNFDKSKVEIITLFDRNAVEEPERNKMAFFDKISDDSATDEVSDQEDSPKKLPIHSSDSDSSSSSSSTSSEDEYVENYYRKKSLAESRTSHGFVSNRKKELQSKRNKMACNISDDSSTDEVSDQEDSHKNLPNHYSDSDSSSSSSSTSSTEDNKNDEYVENYYRKKSLSESRRSLDSHSMHGVVSNRKKELQKNNRHRHETVQPSSCLKKNQCPSRSGFANSFNLPQCLKQVKSRQQPCHCPCGRANLNQRAFPSYQLPNHSNVYQHLPVNSGTKSGCRRKHTNVDTATKNRGGSSSCRQHSLACFMPSQHRCHPFNDSTPCNQRAVCDQWYRMFYNQWLHIQKCSNFST